MATRGKATRCDKTGTTPSMIDGTGCGYCGRCRRWFRLTKAGVLRWHKTTPGQVRPRRAA